MKKILVLVVFVIAFWMVIKNSGAKIPTFNVVYDNPEFIPTSTNIYEISDTEQLKKYVYTIEPNAYVTPEDLDVDKLMSLNFKTRLRDTDPKVLIFHTHSQEFFADAQNLPTDKSIVDVGTVLGDILAKQYSVPVIHDMGKYDFRNGRIQREGSYEQMEPAIKRLLEKYPTIEVAIDLHRDSLPYNKRLITEIDGKPTARIMFFNGITAENVNGQPRRIEGEGNPYLMENLGLSLQMQLRANELFPNFTRKIYIKPYRYSLHMLPKSLLVEVGSDTNTYEEAKNAMEPFAKILMSVLDDKS